MKKLTVLFLFVFASFALYAQLPADVCEGTVPAGWSPKGGTLHLSEAHFKSGVQSVQWNWQNNKAVLQIKNTAFETVVRNPRSTFVLWIYNEKPLNDKIIFDFKKDNKTVSSFYFNLDFTGWRTAWIMYHRDMTGKPVAGMNTLAIHPPHSAKNGSLYFDQILYNVTINPRSPMQDEQVPFVNIHADKAANAHWTALYHFKSNPHYLPLPPHITAGDIANIDTITKRYEKILLSTAENRRYKLNAIEKEFDYWSIKRTSNTITGRPIYSVNDIELVTENPGSDVKEFYKRSDIKAYSELLFQVASAYHTSSPQEEKKRYGQMFLDMLDHLEDQGWTAGSGMGALHHLGYNFRDYYSACLLMKPLLKEYNKLERTWKSMAWFSGLGRSQVPPQQIHDSNIDVFNTLLGSMLSTALIMDNSTDKVRQLHEFSAWLSKTIEPTYSIDGTFKPDGAVFHHGNLYPAYGVGGFEGITPIIYTLSKTSFKVLPTAQQDLKKVLLLMHYYTNPLYWPLSVSGRHPTGNFKIPDNAYAYMALAGSPYGNEKTDTKMAAIYLKINTNKKDRWVQQFTAMSIRPAAYPQGHWNLNYGLLDIHRRQNWLLTVRGHNRYFTTHEAYPGANMFGRYFTYGQLEVLFPQTLTDRGSNFKDEGWDWNSIPGTTTLHVPLQKLRADIINADDYSGIEEMLISDEIFAGGTNFKQRQGMFAMKLHGHDKYDMGSFHAIKSWFMFDSIVVCLGSGITNAIKAYPTETTIFQNSINSKGEAFHISDKKINAVPFQQQWTSSGTLSIVDNRSIGYYLPAQKAVVLTIQNQQSRNQQDTKTTEGTIAKLTINQGNAPKNKDYEYAMLINTGVDKMDRFKDAMENKNPVYKVLQKDSFAHTVYYTPLKITASALFVAKTNSTDSLVASNSRPCLIMYQQSSDSISMSVTDPDLAFYSGPDDSPLTADGKRKEVSIYSRSWYKTNSKPSVVKLELKGAWKAAPSAAGRIQSKVLRNGNTMLSVDCKYGIASAVRLVKANGADTGRRINDRSR